VETCVWNFVRQRQNFEKDRHSSQSLGETAKGRQVAGMLCHSAGIRNIGHLPFCWGHDLVVGLDSLIVASRIRGPRTVEDGPKPLSSSPGSTGGRLFLLAPPLGGERSQAEPGGWAVPRQNPGTRNEKAPFFLVPWLCRGTAFPVGSASGRRRESGGA